MKIKLEFNNEIYENEYLFVSLIISTLIELSIIFCLGNFYLSFKKATLPLFQLLFIYNIGSLIY